MRRAQQQHVQQRQQTDEASTRTGSTTPEPAPSRQSSATVDEDQQPFGWMHSQVMLQQARFPEQLQHMRDQVLLDSQSSVDLLCNRKMTTRVFQSKSTLSLATNAGTMETHEKAEMSNSLGLPDYGHTWFDEDAMTNVLSLANMVKKYRVCLLYTSPSPRD